MPTPTPICDVGSELRTEVYVGVGRSLPPPVFAHRRLPPHPPSPHPRPSDCLCVVCPLGRKQTCEPDLGRLTSIFIPLPGTGFLSLSPHDLRPRRGSRNWTHRGAGLNLEVKAAPSYLPLGAQPRPG